MAGRNPKPPELKIVTGNPGKRPVPKAPRAVGALKEPPATLTDRQREIWDYAIAHAPLDVVRKTDASVLMVWCVAVDRHEDAATKLSARGSIVRTPRTGVPMQSPYFSIMKQSAELILQCASQLGFTPVARAKLALPADPPKAPRKHDPTAEFFAH